MKNKTVFVKWNQQQLFAQEERRKGEKGGERGEKGNLGYTVFPWLSSFLKSPVSAPPTTTKLPLLINSPMSSSRTLYLALWPKSLGFATARFEFRFVKKIKQWHWKTIPLLNTSPSQTNNNKKTFKRLASKTELHRRINRENTEELKRNKQIPVYYNVVLNMIVDTILTHSAPRGIHNSVLPMPKGVTGKTKMFLMVQTNTKTIFS